MDDLGRLTQFDVGQLRIAARKVPDDNNARFRGYSHNFNSQISGYGHPIVLEFMATVIGLLYGIEVIAMNATQSRAARRALDRRLSQLPPAATFMPPAQGWIRAVRNALGMSAADLGARLQVTAASVSDMERSEHYHRIRLDTLTRAAEAMGCELVYALIPRGSLTEMVQQQALGQVGRQVHAVSRAMDLEAQSTQLDDEVVREEMQRLIDSGRLWK